MRMMKSGVQRDNLFYGETRGSLLDAKAIIAFDHGFVGNHGVIAYRATILG